MEKKTPGLTTPVALVLTAIVLVALVAVAPVSGWSFRNQLDAMHGGWRKGAVTSMMGITSEDAPLEPVNLLKAESLEGPDETSQLAAALSSHESDPNPLADPRQVRKPLQKLVRFCESHPELVGSWAHLARLASTAYRIPLYGEPPVTDARTRRIRGVVAESDRRLALKAIKNGRRLEPSNAYFVTLEAAAYQSSGDSARARALWIEASKLPAYNAHMLNEHEVRMAAVEKRLGYRGEFVKSLSMGTILLPHVTGLRNAAKQIRKDAQDDTALRLAVLRCAYTMALHCETSIEHLIAAGMARSVCAPYVENVTSERVDKWPVVIEGARALDAKTKGKDSGALTAEQIASYFAQKAKAGYGFENNPMLEMSYGSGLFWSATLLLASGLAGVLTLLLMIRAGGRQANSSWLRLVLGAVFWALAVLALSWLWVDAQIGEAVGTAFWWQAGAVIVTGMLLLFRIDRSRRVTIAAMSVAVLAVGYVVAVGMDIKDNERYRQVNKQFLEEAAAIRSGRQG